MTNGHYADKIRRYVYAPDRIKSDNDNNYYIVDAINDAIDQKRKIRFRYTDFDIHKSRVVVNNGIPYTVSPSFLIWDGDYYYLRGYCDEREAMRNFRIDRIEKQPEILAEAAVIPAGESNPAEYSREVFRMYDTDEPQEVVLQCEADTMKYIIDNFGIDVDTVPIDEKLFQAKVKVCTSATFYPLSIVAWGIIMLKREQMFVLCGGEFCGAG